MSNRSNMLQPVTPVLGKKCKRTNPLPLRHQLSTTVPASQTSFVPSFAGNVRLIDGQLGEAQLSSRNLIRFSQSGSVQFFPALPLTALAFHLPNHRTRERTRRAVTRGQARGPGAEAAGVLDAGRFVRALYFPGRGL